MKGSLTATVFTLPELKAALWPGTHYGQICSLWPSPLHLRDVNGPAQEGGAVCGTGRNRGDILILSHHCVLGISLSHCYFFWFISNYINILYRILTFTFVCMISYNFLSCIITYRYCYQGFALFIRLTEWSYGMVIEKEKDYSVFRVLNAQYLYSLNVWALHARQSQVPVKYPTMWLRSKTSYLVMSSVPTDEGLSPIRVSHSPSPPKLQMSVANGMSPGDL